MINILKPHLKSCYKKKETSKIRHAFGLRPIWSGEPTRSGASDTSPNTKNSIGRARLRRKLLNFFLALASDWAPPRGGTGWPLFPALIPTGLIFYGMIEMLGGISLFSYSAKSMLIDIMCTTFLSLFGSDVYVYHLS